MRVKVVDASALAATIFNEPNADAVNEAIADAPLMAPTLLGYELANICVKKLKLYPGDRDRIFSAYNDALVLPIEQVKVDSYRVVALAEEYQLTGYDAAYLWLAITTGTVLITLDKSLQSAAIRAGVS